jgi:excisionase family DNA binding protein
MRPKRITVFTCDHPIISDLNLLSAKVLLRPDEVADILRISRSQVYDMIATGELDGRVIGGAKRITSASVSEKLKLPAT